MTLIISICGLIIGSLLVKLGCGIDNPHFYVIVLCYIVPHAMWMIKEYRWNNR